MRLRRGMPNWKRRGTAASAIRASSCRGCSRPVSVQRARRARSGDKVRAPAKETAEAVTGALGGRGLFGVELFVKGQEVWFSEVSPRPHDTGMVTMATQAQNEFELHVRAMLGLPVGTRMRRPGASAVIYGGVEAEGIRFENVDAALRVPESQLRLFGKPVAYERRRMGVALAPADRVETART